MSAGHGASATHANSSTTDIGLREEDLDRAAELAVQSPYPNPTPLTRQRIRVLLDDAFHGRPAAGRDQPGLRLYPLVRLCRQHSVSRSRNIWCLLMNARSLCVWPDFQYI
jgi:hypothetical protein